MAVPGPLVNMSPLLKNKDIVNFFKELNLEFSEEELKNPTPEKLREVLEWFVEFHMCPSRTELKQAPFCAIEQLSHPEIHEQGVVEIATYKYILQMLWQIGLNDASLRNLMYPDFQSTKVILSAAINFALFRCEHVQLYQEFNARTDELIEVRAGLDADLAALKPEIEKLQVSYNKVAPALKTRESEVSELKEVITRLHKEQTALREEVKVTKEEIQQITEKIANEKFLALNAQRECDRLRCQIVQSPEKLRGRLSQMETDISIKKQQVEGCDAKLRDMQAHGITINKVLNKLAKRLTALKDCEEDKKKAKQMHQELKQKVSEGQREEEKFQELRGTSQHLERRIAASQEKSASLQRQGEQKRVEAQQALDETERKKRELEFSIQQDKAQVKQNQGIIQRKEQEVMWLNQEHAREMALLKQQYQQFASSLKAYHASMTQAISIS